MNKWFFKYVDGTMEDVSNGLSFEIINNDDSIGISAGNAVRGFQKATILNKNIVDLQHIAF